MIDGNRSMTVDYAAGIRQVPVYDLSDRLVSVREYDGTDISANTLRTAVKYAYASKTNYLTSKSVTIPVSEWTINYTYGKFANGQMPDQVYTVTYPSGGKTQYAYDALGRRTTETILYYNANVYTNSYTYQDGAGSDTTSTQVATYSTLNGTYGYTYDGNGNITQIVFSPAGGGASQTTRYAYDEMNRLTREDNPFTDKTYRYRYDKTGNILKSETYAYTTGTLPASPTSSVTYTYDAAWKDKLTKYGSQNITYDAIGNPTAIGVNTLQWTGRMLDSYTSVNNLCEYTYDVNGQRYRKTVDGDTTEFYYADGQLAAQTWDNCRLTFLYDENGSPCNIYYHNGTTGCYYTYVKNLQGDIVAIANSAGTIVATYTYDAWGRLRAPSDTDSLHIGEINPLRYRGYYFDEESGFYYLNSRYYNPVWGRFINADSIVTDVHGIVGFNFFAYCGNNPVNRFDPFGTCFYDINGVWRHDNWEYLGGYKMKPEPEKAGETSSGKTVYVANDANYTTVKPSVKVIDYYDNTDTNGNPNPDFQIVNSAHIHSVKEKQEICMMVHDYYISNYYTNPEQLLWNRSVESLYIEWTAHNIGYKVFGEKRCLHVDLDAKDGGKSYADFLWQAITEMLFQ